MAKSENLHGLNGDGSVYKQTKSRQSKAVQQKASDEAVQRRCNSNQQLENEVHENP